jgi:hypothetical protein
VGRRVRRAEGQLVNGWTSGEIFGVMVVDAGHYLRTSVLIIVDEWGYIFGSIHRYTSKIPIIYSFIPLPLKSVW